MNAYLRSWAKRILPEQLQNSTKKHLHKAGLYTWPTKSYETWLILQNLLYLVRPMTLVEFGSGRSTNYLAEYAFKMKARLVSFEQNRSWTNNVNRALKLAFLPDKTVIHAPISGIWYDEQVIARYLAAFPVIECLFLDGPAEFDSVRRDTEGLHRQIRHRLAQVKIIIIDDVDCEDCHQLASQLVSDFRLKRFDIAYNQRNKLAFMLSGPFAGVINHLPGELKGLLMPAV